MTVTTTKKPKVALGKRVRLLRELRTHGGEVFAVGTELTVSVTWRGTYTLEADKRLIRHVARSAFEVIE